MSDIKRALLLSALATGVAAFVVRQFQSSKMKKRKTSPDLSPGEVDADKLSETEIEQLTDELSTML